MNKFQFKNKDHFLYLASVITSIVYPIWAIFFYLGWIFDVAFKLYINDKKLLFPKIFTFSYILFLYFLTLSLIFLVFKNVHNWGFVYKMYINYILYFIIFLGSLWLFLYSRYNGVVLISLLYCGILILSVGIIYKTKIQGMDHPSVLGFDVARYSYLLSIVLSFLSVFLMYKKKLMYILIFFSGIIALSAGLSRTSLLAFLIALSFIFLQKRNIKSVLYIFIIVLFFLISFNFNDSFHDRFVIFISPEKYESSYSVKSSLDSIYERIRLWQASSKMLNDNILTGVGFQQFQKSYKNIYSPPDAIEPNLLHAHNNIINFFAEGGLLLGIPFFLLNINLVIMWLAFSNKKSIYVQAGLIMSISYFLTGLADMNFDSPSVSRIYFLLMGFCYAMAVREKNTMAHVVNKYGED